MARPFAFVGICITNLQLGGHEELWLAPQVLHVALCLLCSLRTRDLRSICRVLYNRGVLAMKYGDRQAMS